MSRLHGLVGGPLAAVLMGATVAYLPGGQTPSVSPGSTTTSSTAPVVSLDPTSGPPGTTVTATASQNPCGYAPVEIGWVEEADWVVVADGGSTPTAELAVPDSFAPGSHDVGARCQSGDGSAQTPWATASFTVTAVPELSLDPDSGPPGTTVTATASQNPCGYAPVEIGWVEEADWVVVADGGSTPTAELTVPDTFAPGSHDVGARCQSGGDPWVTTAFTATAPPTATTEPPTTTVQPTTTATVPPQLTLVPNTGPPGTTFAATASGHRCAEVVFLWRDGNEAGRSSVGGAGTARADITVPDDFAQQDYELTAQCPADGYRWPAASFTVAATAASTSWWPATLAPLILVAPFLFALRTVRRRRGRSWARIHTRVAPGAAARRRVTTTESSAEPSSADVVVRIEPHADAGTRIIEKEVDE